MRKQAGKINIILIAVIVLVQVLLTGAVYFFFFRNTGGDIKPLEKKESESEGEAGKEKSKEGESKEKGSADAKDYLTEFAIFTLEDIVVNPNGSTDKYLVVSIAFEYKTKEEGVLKELESKVLLIKDKISFYFSSKKYDELAVLNNRDKFKKDIMAIVNSQLKEGKITNVLFSQFVLQ